MDYTGKEGPIRMERTDKTEKKTFADRVEDFFEDYSFTMTEIGFFLGYAAILFMTGSCLKKASKNGLTVNVITPFPVKTK